jgi:radical SAM family uncharacterized protein
MIQRLNDLLYQVSRPGRYTGGEWNSIRKDWDTTPVKIALSYPDTYEIGMSNLALPILYKICNDQPDVLAERVFAPWTDMEDLLRRNDIPLYSLESRRPLSEFDIMGFSLGYELTYTTMLNMLDLAGIPLFSHQRNESHPLVIAGGSCVLNPEPIADFIDLFVIGDAEVTFVPLIDVYRTYKENRQRFLRRAAALPGVYVPAFYTPRYNEDGTFAGIAPTEPEATLPIERQFVASLPHPVTSPVVPYIEVVHDRGAIEVQRGCTRGCRFCQAGTIYRPVRRISPQEILDCTGELIENCGYNEVSLVSLSTGDYPDIDMVIKQMAQKYSPANLSISLPSLRMDTSSIALIESLPQRKKITLTFAPEAGTERLRRAINKNIPEEVILDTFAAAFDKGWMNLKLYFMIGLPSETIDDVKGIIELVNKIYQTGKRIRNKAPSIRVSISTFVPKPHTPCQWIAQETEAQISSKQELLRHGLRKTGTHLSWQDPHISQLEAVFARGDRRLGNAIYKAWEAGCKFDTWKEHFNYGAWLEAFRATGIDPDFYARRDRPLSEVLPWSHIETGITGEFLQKEFNRIWQEEETVDCRTGPCAGCGLHLRHTDCRNKSVTPTSRS